MVLFESQPVTITNNEEINISEKIFFILFSNKIFLYKDDNSVFVNYLLSGKRSLLNQAGSETIRFTI